jgi:outer membrane protein assembly factor BamB
MNRSSKHSKSSWASSTPTTNGEFVFVAFADKEHLTLAAYTFAGDLEWRRVLGRFTSQHGHGVSPIIYKDMLIIPNDQMGPSNIIALDAATGETRWSALREFRRTSYATPFVLAEPGHEPQLICLSGATGISSLNPDTGELNWMTGELPARTVASPVFADGLIVATCGGGGVGKLLISAAADSSEETGETRIRYQRERTLPYVPTPVVYQGHIYLWNDNGVVSCIKAATGENVWTKRVGGNFSGSPICVDGVLYCISEDGEVVALAASPEYELYGKSSLGDPSHATPAVANGRMYLRTFHKLFCLAAQPQASEQ